MISHPKVVISFPSSIKVISQSNPQLSVKKSHFMLDRWTSSHPVTQHYPLSKKSVRQTWVFLNLSYEG